MGKFKSNNSFFNIHLNENGRSFVSFPTFENVFINLDETAHVHVGRLFTRMYACIDSFIEGWWGQRQIGGGGGGGSWPAILRPRDIYHDICH